MSYTLRANSQNDPKPYYIVAALVFVAIVIFGTLTVRQLNREDYSLAPDVSINKDVPKPLPTNLISAESVKNLAAAKAPESTVNTVNLQKNNDQLVYVVGLESGQQLTFDAKTGSQLPTANTTNDASKPADSSTATGDEAPSAVSSTPSATTDTSQPEAGTGVQLQIEPKVETPGFGTSSN